MNLELRDPFEQQQEYPELIDECLEDGPVLCLAFHRSGTLLAGGCADGRCLVWDVDTKGVVRTLRLTPQSLVRPELAHQRPPQEYAVISVCWGKRPFHLMTASKFGQCTLWDLAQSIPLAAVHFECGLVSAVMDPLEQFRFAACTVKGPIQVHSFQVNNNPNVYIPEVPESSDELGSATVAAFDQAGLYLFVGYSRGQLQMCRLPDLEVVHVERIGSCVKNIAQSRDGRDFLINSNDRIIRVFQLDGHVFQLRHKLQDLVNRAQWSQCGFSPDGDYIVAGTGGKVDHNIFVWDKEHGSLIKILEGPREGVRDVAWHPIRPIIASVSGYGAVYLWQTSRQESWSAFAPDFTELESNVEYIEREDEFDILVDENGQQIDPEWLNMDGKQRQIEENQDEIIDIFSRRKTDEVEEELPFLPPEPLSDYDDV